MSGEGNFDDLEAFLSGAPVLQRVLDVNITVPARMGGRLIVSCAEIWTTLTVIHYATVGSDAMQWQGGRQQSADFQLWQQAQLRAHELRDDLGNKYAMASGGGGGGGDPAMPIVQYQTSYRGPLDERANHMLFWPVESAASEPVRISVR